MEPSPQNESASSSAANNQPQQSVPSSWPGAFGAYHYSKAAVKQNLGTIIILLLIGSLVGGGAEWSLKQSGSLVSLIFNTLIISASTLVYLASVRRQKISLGQAFSQGFPFWLKMIGLYIVTFIACGISLLLFIIPFFFVLPRLVLAPYFLVDKKMGIMDAYKASWAASKGHATQVWGIIGVSILIALLMATIIGIPFALYFLVMYSGVFAVLYEFINKHPVAAAVSNKPATPAAAQSPVAPAPPAA
ncbi:MAG: hypothetical protein WA843_03585 [Candidatus Saccharimonadales bacterium]